LFLKSFHSNEGVEKTHRHKETVAHIMNVARTGTDAGKRISRMDWSMGVEVVIKWAGLLIHQCE
jgi:hypothetical protein